MSRMNVFDWITFILVLIGAVNWGIVAFFDTGIIAAIFGTLTPLTRFLYILVGLSGLWMIYVAVKMSHKT
jgi:uncharacterized protein